MSKEARKESNRPPGVRCRPGGEWPRIDAAELVHRCLAGSEEAWSEFLRRYGDLIYATLRRKVDLKEEEIEDVFQDAIVSIYRNLPRLRDPGRILSWIIQIAYREGINRIRGNIRRRGERLEMADPAWLDTLSAQDGPSPGETPGEEWSDLERAQRIQEAFRVLPERCREILDHLFYRSPTPGYAELSRRIGIPVGSIGPTRARCLERMRRFFAGRGWV